jgi:hypothetical protein
MAVVGDLAPGAVAVRDFGPDLIAIFKSAYSYEDAALLFVRTLARLFDKLKRINNLLLVVRHPTTTRFQKWKDTHAHAGEAWVDEALAYVADDEGEEKATGLTPLHPLLDKLSAADIAVATLLQGEHQMHRQIELEELDAAGELPPPSAREAWLRNHHVLDHVLLPFIGRLLQSQRVLSHVFDSMKRKRAVCVALDAVLLRPFGCAMLRNDEYTFVITARAAPGEEFQADAVRAYKTSELRDLSTQFRYSCDPTARIAFWVLVLATAHGRSVVHCGDNHVPSYLYILALETVYQTCHKRALPSRYAAGTITLPAYYADVMSCKVKVLHATAALDSFVDLTVTFLNLNTVYHHLPWPALQAVACSGALVEGSGAAFVHMHHTDARVGAVFDNSLCRPSYVVDAHGKTLSVYWPFVEHCERAKASGRYANDELFYTAEAPMTCADYVQFSQVNFILCYYLGELLVAAERIDKLHSKCETHGKYDAYGFKTWLTDKGASMHKSAKAGIDILAQRLRESAHKKRAHLAPASS